MSTDTESERQFLIQEIKNLSAIIQHATKRKNSNKSLDVIHPNTTSRYRLSQTQGKSKCSTSLQVNPSSSTSPENVSTSWVKNGTESSKEQFSEIKEVSVNIQNQKSQVISLNNMRCHSKTVKDSIFVKVNEQLDRKTKKEALEIKLKETEENIRKLKMCIAKKKEIQKTKDHLAQDSISSFKINRDIRESPRSNCHARSKFQSVTPISDLISSNIQRQECAQGSGQIKGGTYNTGHLKPPHSSWWQKSKIERYQQKSHSQKTSTQWQEPKLQWNSTSVKKDSSITPISDLITKNLKRQAALDLEQKQPRHEIHQQPKNKLATNGKAFQRQLAVANFRRSSTKSKAASITPISDQISRNLAKMISPKYPKFPSEKKWTKQSHSVNAGEVKLSYQHSWHLKSKSNSQYSWQTKSQIVANVIKSKYRLSYVAQHRNNFWIPQSRGIAWKINLGFHKAKPTHRKYQKWWKSKEPWKRYMQQSKRPQNLSTKKSRYQVDKRVQQSSAKSGQVTRAMASVLRGQCLVMIDGRVFRTSQSQLAGGHTSSPGQVKKGRFSLTKKSLPVTLHANRKWKSLSLISQSNFSTANTRILASRVLQRSIHTVATKTRKNKGERYCMFYNRFGKCNRGDKCKYIHDPEKVAVCTRFLRGTCSIVDCPFSHKVDKDKMPVCSYFLRGVCNRENCPYLHVKVNKNAEVCQDFLRGFCSKGTKCKKSHTLICPVFAVAGSCPDGDRCKLKHRRHRGTKRKSSEATARSQVVEELQDANDHDSLDVTTESKKLPTYISITKTGATQSSSVDKQQASKAPGEAKKLKIKPEFLS